MSKERELLKEIMCYFAKGDITIRKFEDSGDIAETLYTVQELLAQPEKTEQEPVAWIYEWVDEAGEPVKSVAYNFYDDANPIPLYTAPPKRKPLTPQQISEGNQSMLNVTREAFKQGVIFAEKAHGITGGVE